jgi:hypothetical protein
LTILRHPAKNANESSSTGRATISDTVCPDCPTACLRDGAGHVRAEEDIEEESAVTRSPAATSAAGIGAALLAFAVLADPVSAGAREASPKVAGPLIAAGAEVTAPGVDASTLVGIAAIAGAGNEVRHVMGVAGPDPRITLPPTAGPGATATPVVPVAPAPGLVGPAAPRDAARSGIARRWSSGASGDAAENGSFGTWRGEPLTVAGTWSDTTAQEQTDIYSLDAYRNWNGDIDVAIGALVSGESWAQAAAGACTGRWTQAIRNVRAKRAGRSGTTYIRFAHEMTGDWYPWKVTPGNVTDFKTSWRRFHDLLAREFPQAKLVFSPNDGNASGVSLDQIWPGDDVVDVVGPDSYDGYPDKTNEALWDQAFTSTHDGPQGLGTWQSFAKAHGKPMAVPEWGLRFSDNPFYITKMHEFLASCAPRPGDASLAGRCIYDIYFNIVNGGNSKYVIYGGSNPNAADTYKSLRWGTR